MTDSVIHSRIFFHSAGPGASLQETLRTCWAEITADHSPFILHPHRPTASGFRLGEGVNLIQKSGSQWGNLGKLPLHGPLCGKALLHVPLAKPLKIIFVPSKLLGRLLSQIYCKCLLDDTWKK